MTKDEALKLALEALEEACGDRCNAEYNPCFQREAITAIKEALAQPEQEPVAWLHRFIEGGISIGLKPADLKRHPERWEPLYTYPPQTELVCVCGAVWEGQELVETPPQSTWVGLTDEEKNKMAFIAGSDKHWLISLVENKLKKQNETT